MLEPTIGIEVHVELKSTTKVFSDSQNEFTKEANKYVNVIDMGYPGTLPLINKKVIDMAISAALALNCKINKNMHFDRKNYFYPDLPKGYQITQKDTPIGYDGYIEIEVNGEIKQIGIERIHIEEDTCKSIHGNNKTMLNYNRAGVPLVEIVTKPVIASSEEAVLYVTKLREIMLYLGISDVKIEEGSMRCDANVSLKNAGSTKLGTKTEIKNIGSLTNVGISIEYEIKRQKEILENGGKIVEETRRYDDKLGKTILMRTKETGNEYRYFPEPDIPYIIIDDEWINNIKSKMPVFADILKKKYKKLGVNDNAIKTVTSRLDLCQFYESVIDSINPIIAANILTGDILSYLNKNSLGIDIIDKESFITLVNKLDKGEFNSKQGKDVLGLLLSTDDNINTIIHKLGIDKKDNIDLESIIDKIINDNEQSVKDYKEGKDRAIKYLMGQVMKETKGNVNPVVANKLLVAQMDKINL